MQKKNNKEIHIQYVEVPAGGVSFHHGQTWHGSGINTSKDDRRAIVAHCIPSSAKFHPTNVGGTARIYKNIKKLIQMKWMKVFFQFYGHKKEGEQMFDEEEVKKDKPIDFDDLSVEEIELMIKDHQEQIEILKKFIKSKKRKIRSGQKFF